jgi:hypothetical protein
MLQLGVTPHHRRGFAPVAAVLAGAVAAEATLLELMGDPSLQPDAEA